MCVLLVYLHWNVLVKGVIFDSMLVLIGKNAERSRLKLKYISPDEKVQ